MARMAGRPTLPVPQTTIRFCIKFPLVRYWMLRIIVDWRLFDCAVMQLVAGGSFARFMAAESHSCAQRRHCQINHR
jgi:hypothetical protein